jgi:hypothetical protein
MVGRIWRSHDLTRMTSIVENVPDDDAEARRKQARQILARASLRGACGGGIVLDGRARAILEPQLDLVLVLEEAVSRVRLRRGWMEFEVDLGRAVGRDHCVHADYASLEDEAWFVMRRGHAGATRVEVEDFPALERTSIVTLVTDGGRAEKRGQPRLMTAWIGGLRPPEPWEPRLSETQAFRAMKFWSSHALDVQPDARQGQPFLSTFREVIEEAKVMLAYQEIQRGKFRSMCSGLRTWPGER